MKKLTVNEQEELFAQDCKLINLRYEYSGFTGTEKWAIITELSEEALWDKYPDVISRYTPFILLSMAQGEVISESHRNNDKYEKRSKRGIGMSQNRERKRKFDIPIWCKANLTIEEAAAYSGIGMAKLYEMTESEDCPFVLWIGSRRMIKRKVFDEYIERQYSI